MKACDPESPLMMFVYKLLQDNGRFFALCRVFSGKISSGIKCPDKILIRFFLAPKLLKWRPAILEWSLK